MQKGTALVKTTWFARNRSCLEVALGNFLACVVTVWGTFTFLGHTDQIIYFWPLTGVELGVLLPYWNNHTVRRIGQLTGALGMFAGGAIAGLPLWFAAVLACLNTLEVWIAGAILCRGVAGFEDLKRRKNLLLFIAAGSAGPLIVAPLAAFPVMLLAQERFFRTAMIAVLADSLGIAIVLPALLFVLTGKYRHPLKLAPFLKAGAPLAILFAVVVGWVFWQQSKPLIFMIFPPMVMMLLVMGLEGAVFCSISLSLVGFYATMHGHGPMWLSHVASPEERMLLLQLNLWLSVATALPVGALLDERSRAEIAANEARDIYLKLLKYADDMIVLSSMDGKRFVSAASKQLTGWTPEEFLQQDRLSLFHPDDREIANLVLESMAAGKSEHSFRYRIAQKNGGWRWVEAYAKAYYDEKTNALKGYVGTVRDITALKNVEEEWTREKQQMNQLARTDALTGLANRRAFDEAVEEQIVRAKRGEAKASLLMIDVDYFKLYNDTYGHQAGDECLCAVAKVLQQKAARAFDVVARWGGEEFAVLLYGSDQEGAHIVANEMLEGVRQLNIQNTESPHGRITISIGIAALDVESIAEPSLWVQHADRALYLSKRTGRDRATSDGWNLLSA